MISNILDTERLIAHERDEIINLKFLNIQQKRSKHEYSTGPTVPHTAFGHSSISHSPFMDSEKDGLAQAVRLVLPLGRRDWTIRNTGGDQRELKGEEIGKKAEKRTEVWVML